MNNGVTISQAAAFAGVTVKTVRHYHKHGLVEEPRRDSSGYRRYGPAELLRLVQVRTLAASGVPLAEIGPMLDELHQVTQTLVTRDDQLKEAIDNLGPYTRILSNVIGTGPWLRAPRAAEYPAKCLRVAITPALCRPRT